jgi:predicted dehydrogenase/threonine dehydrogenase-like Zn-dependent dehydrogenase
MKQIIQSYKTGELGLFDVPPPICGKNGILIKTTSSLVSAGTEKMIVDIAKKSLLGKAKARPDLVKQVINKMKQEGIKNTLEKVFAKLDTPIPLGYSCAGKVMEVGGSVSGVSIGDRVACGGAGYANHSEINYIPKNLFVKIPDDVDDIDASFVTVGAIALQGVRQAEPTLGERIVVIGLGLIGQLTVQILKACGCKVLGTDIDEDKLTLAKGLGADVVAESSPEEWPSDSTGQATLKAESELFTNGFGVDAVIITASTSSNQPIIDAGEITRLKGRVVVVGMVGMDIPRNLYYKKELELKLSMAYGPGRYDPQYEEHGIDYPYAYVRWTEQRNFEAFLYLVAEGKITPKKLITHQFDFNDALKAYDLLEGKSKEKYLGIVLTYGETQRAESKGHSEKRSTIVLKTTPCAMRRAPDAPVIGLIGAGNFARSVILPTIKKVGGFELAGLCTATGLSAHTTGKKHGFEFITTDNEQIFNNKEINTVFITTRHNTHAEYVIKALKAGKHVFVEKPLCLTIHDLEEIAELFAPSAERQAPSVLMVGFNRRFSPLILKMKEVVNGMPLSIIYRINAGFIPRDSWIQDKEVGGGRIIGEVCHFIDTCSYLTGSIPVSVFASCVKKDDQSIPNEDNVSVLLTFENGSNAVINYSAYGNKQMPKEYIEVFSHNIAMQMNDFRELIVYRGSKKKRIANSNQDKGFVNEFEAFKQAIKTGAPAITFDSIYKTTMATFKILESLRSNTVIAV